MAHTNKVIQNPITRQDIRFLQTRKDTDGKLLEMEATYHAHSKEPPAHYHPYQVEDFRVLSGELTVRMDGQVKVLKQGETLHIPENTAHSMWNNSGNQTIVNWKVRPAMETEYLLEIACGIANDVRTNQSRRAGKLHMALLIHRYSKVFRLAKPAFVIQKFLFVLMTPFAYFSGVRPNFRQYLD